MRNRLLLSMLLVSCTLLAAGMTYTADGEFPDKYYYFGPKRPEALRKMEGQPPPALALKSWIGEEQDLSKLKGKVVVVDFWATWCGPCMKAVPHNVTMFKAHKDEGLMIIGVHDSKRGFDKMPAVAKDKGINYPLAVDAGSSAKAYNVSFWPTYVVIDRKGMVRAAGLDPSHVEEVVEKLLKEKAE